MPPNGRSAIQGFVLQSGTIKQLASKDAAPRQVTQTFKFITLLNILATHRWACYGFPRFSGSKPPDKLHRSQVL